MIATPVVPRQKFDHTCIICLAQKLTESVPTLYAFPRGKYVILYHDIRVKKLQNISTCIVRLI